MRTGYRLGYSARNLYCHLSWRHAGYRPRFRALKTYFPVSSLVQSGMLDPKLLDDPAVVTKLIHRRRVSPALFTRLEAVDKQRKQLIQDVEHIKQQQNQLARMQIGPPNKEAIQQGKDLKTALSRLEPDLRALEEEYRTLLLSLPNLPADDVPEGTDESDNVELKRVGQPKMFTFPPKDHVTLGEALDIIDIKRAVKVAGTRMGYYKGLGALLELSLMSWVFQKVASKGYTPLIPPYFVKKAMEEGMGYMHTQEDWDNMYHFAQDDIVFISSSEHSVIPMHADELIAVDSLPLKYVNYSPCFRREAGSYGKDTQGLFRVHQFHKVEMNVLTVPDYAVSDLETLAMQAIEEEIVSELELPYRIVHACTGDLPRPNRRMYDLEVWFPSQNKYRETHSCSNCTDYQTRRLKIRTRLKGGSVQFVHALNATVATDRLLLAILENHQQINGYIKIPQPLQAFVGVQEIKL